MLDQLLHVAAFICFGLATVQVPVKRINLVAAGLACCVAPSARVAAVALVERLF